MSMYKGMFEACTVTVSSTGEPLVPYFNMDKMKTYINDYLKTNLSKYCKNYTVTYKFVGAKNYIACKSECRRMKITLTAKINSFYSYSKEQYFSIQEGS